MAKNRDKGATSLRKLDKYLKTQTKDQLIEFIRQRRERYGTKHDKDKDIEKLLASIQSYENYVKLLKAEYARKEAQYEEKIRKLQEENRRLREKRIPQEAYRSEFTAKVEKDFKQFKAQADIKVAKLGKGKTAKETIKEAAQGDSKRLLPSVGGYYEEDKGDGGEEPEEPKEEKPIPYWETDKYKDQFMDQYKLLGASREEMERDYKKAFGVDLFPKVVKAKVTKDYRYSSSKFVSWNPSKKKS